MTEGGVNAATQPQTNGGDDGDGNGVFNMEQLDPDPFMEDLNQYGLPWHVVDDWEQAVQP